MVFERLCESGYSNMVESQDRCGAKMAHHELKYIDRLGQLTLNLTKNSNSVLNNDKEKESAAERTK